MSRFLKIEGKDSNEKFAHLEVILKRFSRRLHKTIIGAVPPSPIFGYAEKPAEDGTIIKCAIPAKGEISRACLVISKYADLKLVTFNVEIANFDIYGVSPRKAQVSFQTRKNVVIAEINLKVAVGDCLTLSTPDGERISGIWTTILYHIDLTEGKIEEIVIDGLDKLIEGKFNEGV